MKVTCELCGEVVDVRKKWGGVERFYRQAAFVGSVYPFWSGRCQSCGEHLCKRGHRTGKAWASEWMGEGYACVQGDCGVFHETWWKLWRGSTNEVGMPEVSDERRALLVAWAADRRGTPEGDAVSEFLDKVVPVRRGVSYAEMAARRRAASGR